MPTILHKPHYVDSLWPSDIIEVRQYWLQQQAITWNQCLLIVSEILWHLHRDQILGNTRDIELYDEFENYIIIIISASPRDHWVNPRNQHTI